jgi:tetratricopeptide (TPR) repeat protein/pimeloyl-ACP methyl ester carboxylesterase
MSRALVLVHGIFSSGKTWDSLKVSIAADEKFASLFVTTFEYSSPRFRFIPTRVIPDYDDIALKLWTFLQSKLSDCEKIAIVSHSQGGLIVQRMLARQVEAGSAQSLARIQQIILLACPNSGSDLFLALRRYAFPWRHPQERALRPLDKALERTRSTVLEKVIHAKEVTSTTCPIIIHAYAGETDGIVKSQSALSAFTSTGMLEGDHSSILDFGAPGGLNYSVIRRHLLDFLNSESDPAPQLPNMSSTTQQDGVLPRPVQLPRAVSDLRGRDDEVKQIQGILMSSPQHAASRVIVITGRGGIGKTALAITVGALTRTSFGDGVLFADLGGAGSAPADPDPILLSFLISLGVPVEIASSAGADKTGLYRSAMAGRRRLVILDNAHSPEQVDRLLPPDPLCAAIVTSRSRFSSMRCDLRINLGPISEEAAKEVLAFYLDGAAMQQRPDEDELASLARLCGRWPLVLHLAGALIARRAATSVSDLITRLRDEKTRLDSLRVGELELRLVLEDSVGRLTADGVTLFRRLSLVPGSSTPAWLIGILLGAEASRSRSALSDMVEANIIEASLDLPDERYSMHDLIRDMSREKMSAEDPEELMKVRTALFKAYRDRSVLSRKVLEPDRPPYGSMDPNLSEDESALLADIGSPERWLELEKNTLMALVEEAYELGFDDIAISIANSLPTYFVIRGNWNEWSAAYGTAIKAAERSQDLVGLGYLLQGLANIQRTKGQGTGAPSLERSLASFIEAGNEVGQGYVMNDIGLIRMYEGRWSACDDALQESERRLIARGHFIMALQPRRNHAISLLERGDASRAARELERVCDEMGERGDVRWRAYSLADLGKAYRLLGNAEVAAERLRSAIDIMNSIGDFRWAAVTRIRLGDVYRSAAWPNEAEAEYVMAAELFNELADPVWGARALVSRALVALDEGYRDKAMALCHSGRETFVALSSKVDECWSVVVESRIYASMGSEEKASAALSAARSLARELGREDNFVDQFLTDTGPDVR